MTIRILEWSHSFILRVRELPAEECVTIATTGDLNLEGKHDFSLNVFDTSLGTNSLVTIWSDSSTTIITINDDDGEIVY